MTSKLFLRQLFDQESCTYTYLLADEQTKEAVLIDAVKEQVSRDLELIVELQFKLKYILETHLHADHITGSSDIKDKTGAKIGISQNANVSCADLQLKEGDKLSIGAITINVIATPGHTDSCLSFYCDGKIFTGDALFVRDVGRTDFQQGCSKKLFTSITQKIFTLPDNTIVYPAHDYRGRSCSSVGEEKKFNLRLGEGKTEEEFAAAMAEMKLAPPKKIQLALPANLRCGRSQ